METHAFFLSMLWKKVRLRRAGRVVWWVVLVGSALSPLSSSRTLQWFSPGGVAGRDRSLDPALPASLFNK